MPNPYQNQIDQLEQQIADSQELLNDPDMAELAQEDLSRLEQEKQQLEQAAQEYADAIAESETGGGASTGEQKINCTVEFRQGTGGDEAKIWANDLMRMYMRYAEQTSLKIEVIDEFVIKVRGRTQIGLEPSESGSEVPNGESEITSLTAYELLQYESGVHRVQRVPETESQGRIHTSTATVAVLPEVSKTAVQINDEDLDWQFMRSSGAGGQSVNKTSSAVRLTHVPSGIVVTARQERKQSRNREIALELLRSQLWEIEEEKRLQEIGQARSVIGRARRSEKIRTYNFPQNRVTDHRTKQSWYNLENILEGNLNTLLSELIPAMQALDDETA